MAGAVDIGQIVSHLSQVHPLLSSVAANAIATGIVHVCHKLAAHLFPGRAPDAEQDALSEAFTAAVVTVLHAHPELGEIDFRTALEDDRVVAELLKVFQAGLRPNAGVFSVVAHQKGFDLSSLSRPLSADEVFSQLVESFQAEVMRDPRLRLARIDSRTERMEPTVRETHSIVAELPERLDAMERRLIHGFGDLAYVLSDLHAEYRTDLEEARDQLKASRFADARRCLDGALAKPTFRHTDMRTQAEVHRLHGLACMRLGDLLAAELSFAAARRCDPSNQKLLLNLTELDLRAGRTEKARDCAMLLLKEPTISSEARRILALAALDRNDVELALQHLDACQDKTTPAWLSIRAVCESERGECEAALVYMGQALQAEPGDPVLLLQKASIQMQRLFASPGLQSGLAVIGIGAQRRQLEEARDTSQAAVESWDKRGLKDYSVVARVQLATVLALLEQKDEALRRAMEATQCHNADSGAWLARARCEMDLGDRVAAQESLGKAREMAPRDAAVVTLGALLKAEEGCPLEATEDIEAAFLEEWNEREKLEARVTQARLLWLGGERERALEFLAGLPPELLQTPRVVVARCEYFLGTGRAAEAQALLEDAVARYRGEPVPFHLAGEAHLAVGDHRSALRRYARALRLAPNPDSLSGIVICCLRLGRFSAALRIIDLFSAKGIRPVGVQELKARAFFGLGRIEEAAQAYEEHIREHPNDLIALNNAAVCWWRLGRRDRVSALLERVAEIDPGDWRACAHLAQLHLTDHRQKEALRWAEEAQSRAKNNPEALLLYFNIALHIGHAEKAFPILHEIADRFPDFPGLKRVPEKEAIQLLQQSLERGEEIERLYWEKKLPITFVADRLNRALPLYRTMCQRAQLSFWADIGTPQEPSQAASVCESASEVVIDYPALVTLAQVGMLDVATRCFRTIHVPSAVREQIQIDRLRLTERLSYLRDRGQKRVRDRLEKAGALQKWRELGEELSDWPRKGPDHDRYLCEKVAAWFLIDSQLLQNRAPEELADKTITSKAMLELLWSKGMVTAEQYATAAQYLQKTCNWNAEGRPPIDALPDRLVIEFLTLSTWECMGLLQLLLDTVRTVLISPWSLFLLNQDVAEEEVHEEALRLVNAIEQAMGLHDSTFRVSQAQTEPPADEQVWRVAVWLAQAKGLLLWSDDLVTGAIYREQGAGSVSFSTRAVIELARQRRILTSDEYHRAVLDLVMVGFDYCSFNPETLLWTIARHNYHPNSDTDILLAKRGNTVKFWGVGAQTLSMLAKLHDEQGVPSIQQLRKWMLTVTTKIAEHTAGIPLPCIRLVTNLMKDRSLAVRLQWEALVDLWESLGWYVRAV